MCRLTRRFEPVNVDQLNPRLRDLVPFNPVAHEAFRIACESLSQPVFNHSFRVFFYAKEFSMIQFVSRTPSPSPIQFSEVDAHVLFVACMFHDMAITEEYDTSPARFEVVGADKAAELLRKHQVDEEKIREVWLAMAMHTTPGIPERLHGCIGAFRKAISADFGSIDKPSLTYLGSLEQRLMQDVDDILPRLDIEKELGDAVVAQALTNRSKAPLASWPGVMVQAYDADPGWDGVNKAF